jgi:phosphoribosylanthranilate isomerase
MALRTIVKVGNISNLSDARYCAGMGVQYLGFALDNTNKDYVDQGTLKTIKEWIVGPVIVGEFSESDRTIIVDSIIQNDIDCIEITNPYILTDAPMINLPVILKIDISSFQNPEQLRNIMDYAKDKVIFFLLDKSTESVIQDEDIRKLADHFKIMKGYSVDKDSVRSWIAETDIFGIALKGGTEVKPGFKEYDELADILEEIEVE